MQIDQRTKDAIVRLVTAGMKVLYAPQMRKMLIGGLKSNAPLPDKVAMQIAGLMKLLDDKSGMKAPKQAIIPAAVILLQDLMKFVSEATGQKVSDEEMAHAMQRLIQLIVNEYRMMQNQINQSQRPQQQGVPGQTQQQQPAIMQQPTGLIGAMQ